MLYYILVCPKKVSRTPVLDKNKVMAYLCSFPQISVVVDMSISYVSCNSFLDDQDIKLIGHSIKNIYIFFNMLDWIVEMQS